MSSLEEVKTKIEELYKNGTTLHISIALTHPKLVLNDAEAHITNVYPNIFSVHPDGAAPSARHTVRYTDVLVGHVKIAELT